MEFSRQRAGREIDSTSNSTRNEIDEIGRWKDSSSHWYNHLVTSRVPLRNLLDRCRQSCEIQADFLTTTFSVATLAFPKPVFCSILRARVPHSSFAFCSSWS